MMYDEKSSLHRVSKREGHVLHGWEHAHWISGEFMKDHLKFFIAEITQGPLGIPIGTIWVT